MLKNLPQAKFPFAESIDLRGKKITTFILFNAITKLKDMKHGDNLEIITEDYEPIDNGIRAWCRMTGNDLAGFEKGTGYYRFYIKKGESEKRGKKVAFVISNNGLEEMLSPLGFALGFALSGNEVFVFFQGPAVRVLKRGFKATLSGLSKPFSVFARKGLNKIGHIPAQEKIRQLKELGARFYICGPSMEHFKVEKDKLIFDDIIMAEYLTFGEVMSSADINFYIQ